MGILTRNWGWVVLRGVVAILFGILAFVNPGITLAALILLYGAYAFADGVFTIGWAIANRKAERHWGALIVAGLVGIGAGVVTWFWPGITTVALLIVIAAWAMAMGIIAIAAAIQLRKEISGEWMLVLSGILAIALGVMLLVNPAAGALAMVWWIGGFAIVSGILLIGLGFKLRSWSHVHQPSLASHRA